MSLTKDQMMKRIAQEIRPNSVVNLGIGMPTLVANFITPEMNIVLQSENGLLGMGPFPSEETIDPDLINAGKQTITITKEASFFSSAESFAMIRGGHIDLTVLGAMEVDEKGNLANWMIPGKMVKGMGGAMDLVAGTKRVIVVMQHCDKRTGEKKLLKQCRLPITGLGVVNLIVTELGVFEVTRDGLMLTERAANVSVEDIQKQTEAKLIIPKTVKTI